MTLYSPFDASSLPMLQPLLYTSTRLVPLRPYSNAVLARLLHPDIRYANSSPEWVIQFPDDTRRFTSSTESSAEQSRDEIVESDPRIVFGETEFKVKRDKYNMPKHVISSLEFAV
jgi:hypothetical protein